MFNYLFDKLFSYCTTLPYTVRRKMNRKVMCLRPQLVSAISRHIDEANSLDLRYPRSIIIIYVNQILYKVMEYSAALRALREYDDVYGANASDALRWIPDTINSTAEVNISLIGIYHDGYFSYCGEYVTDLSALGLAPITNPQLSLRFHQRLTTAKVITNLNKSRTVSGMLYD